MNLFLEISLRPAGSAGGFTSLAPRPKLTATPYAIKSLSATTASNSLQLGGLPAAQFVQATDVRLSDARPPFAGSANYIQNGVAAQASSDFNISGTGKANIFDAAVFSVGGIQAIRSATVNSIYLGNFAGTLNTTGTSNTFAGAFSGRFTTSGSGNTFVGGAAGENETTGTANSFFGVSAGRANSSGSYNTAIGAGADVSGNPEFATAIGAGTHVSSSDTIRIGKSAGIYDGVARPTDTVQVTGDAQISGTLLLTGLGTGGGTSLCRNGSSFLAFCSSSLRYKTDILPYGGGLGIARQLKPISFTWKDGGRRDIGFAAEDVAKVEPLLTFTNDRGEVEGVQYGQISTVLINAVQEQQAQIEKQARQLEMLQLQVNALKDLLCKTSDGGDVCRTPSN